MHDLTEKKWQIVGARMAGISVTKTAELLGFSRAAISKTMKLGKTSSNRSNFGRTSKLTDRESIGLLPSK